MLQYTIKLPKNIQTHKRPESTSDVDIVWVKLQDALSIVVFLDNHHDGGQIANGWRLVNLKAIFSHCKVH